MILFNKPYLTGKEAHYMYQAVYSGTISGNGIFTKKCQQFFEQKYEIKKCLLTTSCTDALEMSAILADIHSGDEVIVPSYTFVSSALAFVRQGAKIIFIDSSSENPNMDVNLLESLITPKTKVIIPVHYAGISCDMDAIMNIAHNHNLIVIEDAAQGIDSSYKGRPLGTIGDMATFSFHETKNIQCGEGGMLAINDEKYIKRSEIIWEKGTNRAEFYRGLVNKYGWVDTGSSFLPADYVAGFLYAQLECLTQIQERRKQIWSHYYEGLKHLSKIKLPVIPDYATNNAHMFYILCSSLDERTKLIEYLKGKDIQSVFHYLSLHRSDFIKHTQTYNIDLPMADYYTDCLLRLPMYYELTDEQVYKIVDTICSFFEYKNR